MKNPHFFDRSIQAGLILALLMSVSCNSNSTTENNGADAKSKETVADKKSLASYCYLQTHERDSIRLRFTQDGNKVEGNLHFDNFQIDGSRGAVKGEFINDTLWVEYDFMAEGMRNNVEEGFLKKGDSLIRGTGTRIQAGEKFVYQDRGSIDFTNGQNFILVECTSIR